MNPAAANLDGHALAARYEVLRHDVVASANRGHTLHSLALLMRKGMAAWIKDVGEELPVREDITPPASSAMCVPEGIERSLVDIRARLKFTGQHRSRDLVDQSFGLGARFRLRCFHGQISVCIIFMHASKQHGRAKQQHACRI